MSEPNRYDELEAALVDASLLDHPSSPPAVPSSSVDPSPDRIDGSVDASAAESRRLGRRGLMTGLGLGGVAIAAGGVGSIATAQAAGSGGWRRMEFAVDIACLGNSGRSALRDWGDQPKDPAFPESTFVIEGWIYPPGTIPGAGFQPIEDGSIGRWFCRAWFINSATRPEPHVVSTVDMVFGVVGGDPLFPTDTLAVQGIEGTVEMEQFVVRPVTGGTGKYLGAAGQVKQWYLGDNVTNVPSWRYEFDIRVFD